MTTTAPASSGAFTFMHTRYQHSSAWRRFPIDQRRNHFYSPARPSLANPAPCSLEESVYGPAYSKIRSERALFCHPQQQQQKIVLPSHTQPKYLHYSRRSPFSMDEYRDQGVDAVSREPWGPLLDDPPNPPNPPASMTPTLANSVDRRASSAAATDISRRLSNGSSTAPSVSTAASSIGDDDDDYQGGFPKPTWWKATTEHTDTSDDDWDARGRTTERHHHLPPVASCTEPEEEQNETSNLDMAVQVLKKSDDPSSELMASPTVKTDSMALTSPLTSDYVAPSIASSAAPIHAQTTTQESNAEATVAAEKDEPSSRPLPVWADPDRVRDNPTRYAYVEQYLDAHGLLDADALPLPSACTFFHSGSTKKTMTGSTYLASVHPVFTSQTMWDFSIQWRRHKAFWRPMQPNANLYCFWQGIQPMWEDAENKQGGRLTLCPSRIGLDETFDWVLSAFVGGNFDQEVGRVNGVVASRRTRGDRVELWLSHHPEPLAIVSLIKEILLGCMPTHLHDAVHTARYKKHF
ncbi:translation initiation factor eIF 4e-like domain-containing protein [Syncephalastrum racemosum]|uniref:Translation initiation factor eIF 4e-like domain-containing protein n=1 Tax=Syncephalastrum racemosum TaxID=13706 RepID=A0A1X2HTK4_SYNRA|nr:translation initiation factor eIF 4e-like domain-containing protein [Syncephalastrum racemosum]